MQALLYSGAKKSSDVNVGPILFIWLTFATIEQVNIELLIRYVICHFTDDSHLSHFDKKSIKNDVKRIFLMDFLSMGIS